MQSVGVNAVGMRLLGARMGCEGVAGRKLLTLGTGPIDSSISVAQSNCCGSHALPSTVRAGAVSLSSRFEFGVWAGAGVGISTISGDGAGIGVVFGSKTVIDLVMI